jgi:maltose O-acetyltransferase
MTGKFLLKLYRKMQKRNILTKFASVGNDFHFSPDGSHFYYENIHIGNHVSIGYNADFVASRSRIIIGDHVVFAPHVSIRGGDHRFDIVGRYIDSITDSEKVPENDQDVVIEGDNWIGMNVTILKGVTIGRGTVVAAGAVVIKSIPPYSICGGIPARVLKKRFTKAQIIEHETVLYGKVITDDKYLD